VRWGRKPRFLIPFFLTDAPVQGRTFTFPDGEKLQLMGGQFVAFGPHKDTGQPYEWDNWEGDWPRITSAQLTSILRKSHPELVRLYASALIMKQPARKNWLKQSHEPKMNGKQDAMQHSAILGCLSKS
jgi:hypothetical protein